MSNGGGLDPGGGSRGSEKWSDSGYMLSICTLSHGFHASFLHMIYVMEIYSFIRVYFLHILQAQGILRAVGSASVMVPAVCCHMGIHSALRSLMALLVSAAFTI